MSEQSKPAEKRTRIPAEDPDAVRDRDAAHIDRLYTADGRRIGDKSSGRSDER